MASLDTISRCNAIAYDIDTRVENVNYKISIT